MNYTHQPVLLNEVIENLNIQPDGIYIDATFGRGGHSREILNRLNERGRLIVIDKDRSAIHAALKWQDARLHPHHGSFTQAYSLALEQKLVGKINGVLLDLGVSSPQLDEPARGFSFLREGPLDMRMNTDEGECAADWIARVDEQKLEQVIKDYGEERYARRIAKAIIFERDQQKITTTTQLAQIVSKAHPRWEKHKHPATRTFQAIRIFINQELDELQASLEQCLDLLTIGGRLLVITFHSLEDKIVKRFMQKHIQGGEWPRGLPITQEQMNIRIKKINGAIRGSEEEVAQNPRARSATLRVMEKLA